MKGSKLLYLNGAFDVGLSGQNIERFRSQVDEMTAWFLPVGDPGDQVLLRCELPESFGDYWQELGVELPNFVREHEKLGNRQDPTLKLTGDAWGWDHEAIDVFKNCGASIDHPAPAVVREANSREFSFGLAQSLGEGFGIPNAHCARSFDEVVRIVELGLEGPLVVKPSFGNSAIGFILLSSTKDLQRKEKRIRQLFECQRSTASSFVTVEPWMPRIKDFSTQFVLARDGSIGLTERYETFVTTGGAFYGMRLGTAPDPITRDSWNQQLDELVGQVGQSLHRIGYFGPVSVDSMIVCNSDRSEELVPLVEINARSSMFRIASSVRQRLAPDQPVLFRTLGRKRHQLPCNYQDWISLLGSIAFDCDSKSGVVCVSPLRVKTNNDWQQPARSLLFVTASNHDELLQINEQLSRCLNLNDN